MTGKPACDTDPSRDTQLDGDSDLDGDTWDALERLGRALHVDDADLGATLHAVLDAALVLVPHLQGAGLNLLVEGRFEPQAVKGEAPHELDQLQQRTGTGPCIDASREQTVVHVRDLRADERWAPYPAHAVELGVLSMICLPLWVERSRLGSLSLYSGSVDGFDEGTVRLAGILATHAALALAEAHRAENLRRALASRDTIGQAKGILMERHRLTADQAFALLSKISQRANRKLADVAEALTSTGALPDGS